VPGGDADGVLYLRRVGDSDQIKAAFQAASRIAVIGAGWIGLECAAAARAAGVEVTVLEAAELPLLRVSAPRSPGSSPACTASTAWTCGSAFR
jgi:NAD(P)H-nitrite reductase